MLKMGSKKSSFHFFILLVCMADFLLFSDPVYAEDPVKIGVLAYRPKPQILAKWQPLATALERAIPSRNFVIQALNYSELETAVMEGKIDFVLTNSAHYVLLSNHVGLSYPLATLAANHEGQALSVFGGVIFCRAGQTNLKDIRDLKGMKIAAPASLSLGGYQAQMYELSHAGIHLPEDASMTFTDMPHDKVVGAVLAGVADAGFVRTGVLESMAREGKLDLSNIKVLNLQSHNEFPLLLSTSLYPEWPFSSLRKTDKELARQVAAALFLLESNSSDAQKLRIHGFVVPADYSPVINLLKELRLPPYELTPVFTLKDIWVQYRWHVLSSLFALAMILILWFRLIVSKRKLELQHGLLEKQRQHLQESEQHIHLLLDSTAEGIYGMDAQGICTFVNLAGLKILGYQEAKELVGGKIHKLIHHSHADGSPYPFKECRAHQAFVHNQQVYVNNEVFWRKDGSCFQVEYWAFPVLDNGKNIGSVTTFFDITERNKMEDALQVSEQRFKIALAKSPVALFEQDLNLRYLWIYNPKLGYAVNDVIGKSDAEIMDASCVAALENLKRGVIESGLPSRQEVSTAAPGQPLEYYDLYVEPLHDKTGAVAGIICAATDITARTLAEQAAKSGKAKLESALASMGDAVFISDTEGRFIHFNDAFASYHKFRNKEECSNTLSEYPIFIDVYSAEGELLPLERWAVPRALRGETASNVEFTLRRKDTGEIWIGSYNFAPIRNDKDEIVGSVVTARDITQRKEIERALLESLNSVMARDNALAHISQGVLITTPDRLITYANRGFEILTGYREDELIGKNCKLLQGIKTDQNTILNMSTAMNLQQVFRGVILNYRKDGSEFWNDLSIMPIFDKQNKLIQFVGVQHDITEHIHNQEIIHKLAFFDSLTQLANRSLLYDRLNQAIAASKRSDFYGALIFLDLDNFKPLNDSYGHDIGDHLLVEVAVRLKRCIREADTVARFGGDEFVVLLTEINSDQNASVEQAHRVAKKILTTLSEPYLLVPEPKQGQGSAMIEHRCSASIGLTLFLKDSTPQDELLRRADSAMYQAKQSGRNKICIFQETMN
jgi:diguanylate cyclase (GGDEF)-like protein/PAS domain S-box-containing protein